MKNVVAYFFWSDLDLDKMLRTLSMETEWKWYQRENDQYGNYLVSRPHRDYSRLRIFAEGNHFVLDAIFDSGVERAAEEWKRLSAAIHEKVLRSVGASNIKEAENFD